MRNYSIYTLKTKLEFTNLYQYLSEKDYKQLEQQILCHSYHTPICTWNGIVINGIEAYVTIDRKVLSGIKKKNN